MIELQDICMCFGRKTVFSSLSLRFDAPGQYAVLGASGCGKTTLLRLICGLQKPTFGRIWVDPDVRMAVCFQEDRLLPWKTALQNVARRKPPAHGSRASALTKNAARCLTHSPAV